MTKDTITIFVTVYNLEPFLDRFFDCLSKQTVTDYEALIIDDGSTDNSLAICRKYAAEDSRIRIIASEHIGISAARNLAIKSINTDLVTSLDGDDIFEKDYLKHLLDVYKKYDADMVISNVVYHSEAGEEFDRFVERPEELIEKERFGEELPKLLVERRFNYLYAKLFRSEYLKQTYVEPDVMQGSDTMINSQYVLKINNIAIADAYDYNYIIYAKRSVTSYSGDSVFERLCRINRFVYDTMEAGGYLNDEMLRVIDGRFLYSGTIAVGRIAKSTEMTMAQKYQKAEKIVQSEEYGRSYRRQQERGNLNTYTFDVIEPGREREYVKSIYQKKRAAKRYETIKNTLPDWVFDAWHKIKK